MDKLDKLEEVYELHKKSKAVQKEEICPIRIFVECVFQMVENDTQVQKRILKSIAKFGKKNIKLYKTLKYLYLKIFNVHR